jgi:hypothetical protein
MNLLITAAAAAVASAVSNMNSRPYSECSMAFLQRLGFFVLVYAAVETISITY